ncbi:MAG: amidohydrolase family protein [Gemmatimonadaceae bacterium]|nr:amidohydrolase family protein [Gemmatimonadaceae bacterium]
MRVRIGMLGLLLPLALSAQRPYDLILRNGTVLDGSGAPMRRADVAIRDGRIVRVGVVPASATATTVLDVRGLMVAPGFINIHSHAEAGALATAENMLQMGVTTELVNADGGGPVDVAQQASGYASRGLAVNVGAFAPFNSVWAQVVGVSDRRPTAAEIARMRGLIGKALADGAWGVSAGLDYKPGYFATADEVVQVVDTARTWHTIFTNHDRLRPETGFSSKLGIAETIEIGTRAGLMPVVTHMKVQGREQGGAPTVLASMTASTRAGRPVAADAYPYLAGQTALAALLVPAWAQDGGVPAFQQRIADPATRARIVAEIDSALVARFTGVTGVYLPESQQPLTKVVADSTATSPGDAVVRLVAKNSPSAILTFGSEADLVQILQYPATSIACDCGASRNPRLHPRYWGTYPRVLGHYVRETHALTWTDAIRKMTALPASTIGLTDRGRLAAGQWADVVVFDSATVIDHATYDAPTRPSDGIVHVVVNGQLAYRDAKVTGVQAGRVITRPLSARSTIGAATPARRAPRR